MTVFLGLLQAIASIPALVGLFDQFTAWYVQKRVAAMKAQDLDVIREALATHDQRPIEQQISSPVAGLPSGDPGTIIVDGSAIGLPKSS